MGKNSSDVSGECPDQLNCLAEEKRFKSNLTLESQFKIEISACYVWTHVSSKTGH